ncbi:protease inhibitor I42 family protein [Chloroflexota bacterium]
MLQKSLIVVLSIMLIAVCLPGCGIESHEVSVEVTCNEFKEQPLVQRELEVTEGNTFTVTLCTSATSGFLWSEGIGISNDTVVMQVEHELKGKGMLDASSEEMWTFQALSTGNCTINMGYNRPWEIDTTQKLWTLDLQVEVK